MIKCLLNVEEGKGGEVEGLVWAILKFLAVVLSGRGLCLCQPVFKFW